MRGRTALQGLPFPATPAPKSNCPRRGPVALADPAPEPRCRLRRWPATVPPAPPRVAIEPAGGAAILTGRFLAGPVRRLPRKHGLPGRESRGGGCPRVVLRPGEAERSPVTTSLAQGMRFAVLHRCPTGRDEILRHGHEFAAGGKSYEMRAAEGERFRQSLNRDRVVLLDPDGDGPTSIR